MADESILEIVLKVRDEATKTIEDLGKKVEETGKKALGMADAFKIAGGIITGAGVAGLFMMKDWIEKGAQAQAITIKTNTLLAAEAEQISTASQAIYANTAGLKEQTKAIQNQVEEKQLQIKHLQLSTGSHKEEIKAIEGSILSLKEQALHIKENGVAHGQLIGYTQASKVSLEALQQTAEAAGERYLELGFNAEEASMSFARLLGPTKDVKVANEALATAADLARFRNLSLDEATTLVTRAYEGNTRALKALGIEVPKGAQGLQVLEALHTRLAGQAENFANSYQGAMARFSVSTEHLKERLGQALLPMFDRFLTQIDKLISWLNKMSPSMVATIAKVTLFGTAFALVAGPLLLMIGFLPAVAAGFGMILGILLPLALILGAVALGGLYISTHWNQMLKIIDSAKIVFENIKKAVADFAQKNQATFQAFFTVITGIWTFSLNFLKGFWDSVWQSVVAILESAWGVMQGIVQTAFGAVQVILAVGMGIITGDWNKAWDLVKQGLGNVWEGIKSVIVNGVNFLINTIKGALNAIIGMINGVIRGFNAVAAKASGGHVSIPEIPAFAQGGYVPRTGLAYVHEGEFVLSQDMISGRRSVPKEISQTVYKQPITINANVNANIDLNQLGYRLAFALRNTR